MMNAVALFLVLTSLATGGVLSPSPAETKQNDKKADHDDQVIVKEGHRVVVVEYEQEKQPITKVSISPEDQAARHHFVDPTGKTTSPENAKEKLKEASSSVLPNLGQGSDGDHQFRTPKELICDAYGKCKHRIASAVEKTKEAAHRVEEAVQKVTEDVTSKAHEAMDKKKEVADKVGEAVKGKAHEAIEKEKEVVDKVGEAVKGKAREAIEKEKEVARKVGEAAEEAYDKAKETVRHTVHEVEHKTRESAQKTKEAVKEAKDLGKTIGVDVAQNVSGFFAAVGRQVMRRAVWMSSVVSPRALNPISGMVYLIGYAIAYGTSVWVTFISSHVLAGALPRQQFGVVQSKIYPVYFRTMAWSIGTAFLGFIVSHRRRAFTGQFEKFQLYNLLSSLLLTFVNMLYLEPKATKVMFERMKVEKEEGRGVEELTTTEQLPTTSAADPAPSRTATEAPEQEAAIRNRLTTLNGRLKKLNTLSSFVNILCLMFLSWHVYYLAQRLYLTC
ncbi:late embryogenesis abundant domain-containing protein / LEA domain-containing protein [Trema orientale]|uniref:Late embryogenesis abundant domain-containing protein / LEA domain-containing protein n=1 Tax=Trema orientale TaxID=63057 RepID=A0A2P5FQP7_TREOI|nr:late embryogenesis abundant domain-containing protein / LEA domain-containing protein [Trema orientale]